MELESKEIVNSMPRIGDEGRRVQAKRTEANIRGPGDCKGK